MVALILFVVVAGYFLLQRTMLGTPVASPKATKATIPLQASVRPPELGKIRGLFDNIRLANLQKNIELFMSCYTGDFGDRDAKKRSTLESWKASDYLDLSYRLIRQSVSGDTANIEVEWLSKVSQKINGELEEGRIVIEALLKKESDTWKIKEIRTVN